METLILAIWLVKYVHREDENGVIRCINLEFSWCRNHVVLSIIYQKFCIYIFFILELLVVPVGCADVCTLL